MRPLEVCPQLGIAVLPVWRTVRRVPNGLLVVFAILRLSGVPPGKTLALPVGFMSASSDDVMEDVMDAILVNLPAPIISKSFISFVTFALFSAIAVEEPIRQPKIPHNNKSGCEQS